MKSQLIIIALICLISFNCLLASQETKRRHHNKARKWAEKDNCVCSSVLACDAAKFSVNLGREDGKGDSNNCQCNKKNACECQAGQTSGVLASDKKSECKCLAECQKSAGAKALDGVKAVGEGVLAVGSAGVEAVKSGLSSAGAAIGSVADSASKTVGNAIDSTGKALNNAAQATSQVVSNAVSATKDLANAAGKSVVNGLNQAANATSQAIDKTVDAAKDAVDVCQCSKADFSKIAKGAAHNVSSTTLVKGLPCNCTEDCVCKDLTIIKRRFAKLQKQHKTTQAKKLLASIQTTYNGNFKNGDTCTCDENAVNKVKEVLASGVQSAKEAGKAVANKVSDVVDSTGKALNNAAQATSQLVGNAVSATKDLANAAGKSVVNGLNNAGDAIAKGASAAVESGKELAKQTGQALSNAGSAVSNAASSAVKQTGQALSNAGSAVSNAASSAVGAVGELLAGECIQTDAKEYKENPKNPSGPWLAQGRQKRSNGLCEVEEQCVCDLGKQTDLKVQSKLQYSQKVCTCEINSATQLINKGKKWISGSRLRFSKKTLIQVRAYCQSLNQPQCLSQDGCSFNQQKQQCNVAKQITKQLRFQRTSKKIQMSRNLNRFKQVVFRA